MTEEDDQCREDVRGGGDTDRRAPDKGNEQTAEPFEDTTKDSDRNVGSR